MGAAERFAFPKEARLLRPSAFRRVQQRGRAFDMGPLVVRVAPSELVPAGCEPRARLGLAVSRKVGGAPVRNCVKRRVREWFRHHQARLQGLDLVVMARPAAAQLGHQEMEALGQKLLARFERP